MSKIPSPIKRLLKRAYYSPILNPLRRLYFANKFFGIYYRPRVATLLKQSFTSSEITNFTYDLTETNESYLAHTIALASGKPLSEIQGYIAEVRSDAELRAHVDNAMRARGQVVPRIECPFARRLGWYALARALKPGVIVETGVDRGHGSVLLCAALLRNAREGRAGRYYGTDINPAAGWLLDGVYASVGKILYGDSLASLSALDEKIGLFINDSDHSSDYEYREYLAIRDKLAPGAVIVGDNAHVTDKLMRFSEETGRRFLYFKEEPKDHWYPGGGLGIAFSAAVG
jgi:predicted O-methyltransferase YrrM